MTYACAKACISLRSEVGFAMAECVVGERRVHLKFLYICNSRHRMISHSKCALLITR